MNGRTQHGTFLKKHKRKYNNRKKLRTPDSPWPFATIGYWLPKMSTTPAGLSSALLYRKGHWGVVPVCSKNAMLSITHCTPAASAHTGRGGPRAHSRFRHEGVGQLQ